MKSNGFAEFSDGLKKGIPIGLGYLAVSFSFGIWAYGEGMPVWMVVFISLSNLTSSGQFAGTQLIFEAASFFEIGLSVFVINIRYILMSLSLTQKLDKKTTLPQKLLFGYGITDEIFAMASMRDREITAKYMYGLILMPVLGWTGGTALGAITGSLLPESLSAAMGIALYAMFIAVIIPPAKKSLPIVCTILISVAITCLFKYVPGLSFVTGGFALIIATITASAIMALAAPVRDEEKTEEVQS